MAVFKLRLRLRIRKLRRRRICASPTKLSKTLDIAGREWIWRQNVRMGGQWYNHIAIVFDPWWKPKRFNFWLAFKDYEFGKETTLMEIEEMLYNYLNKN